MTATPIAFASKDNAKALLAATVQAADLSIPLATGQGALFPQPYSGTASSAGSATTLNATGILAAVGGSSSAMAGKVILNKTDGSVAVIVSVATNALTCTRLLGGTTNVWNSGDRWCIDPFVLTLGVLNTSAYGVQSDGNLEEILVIGRSTDILTVASDGRGYNNTTARQFQSTDYAYVRVTSPLWERLKDILSVVAQQQDADRTGLANVLNASSWYAVATGSSNAYAASYPNISGPLAAGMEFAFKANFANTGSATLTVTLGGSAQAAVTLKKVGGTTNLASGDVQNNQLVLVQYDGTTFQMLNPVGNNAAPTVALKYANTADSNNVTSGTSDTDFNTSYSVPANDLAAGVAYEVEAWGLVDGGASNRQLNLKLKLGSTTLLSFTAQPTTAGTKRPWYFRGVVHCRTASASGTVQCSGRVEVENGAQSATSTPYLTFNAVADATVTVDTTAAATLKLTQAWNIDDGTKHCYVKTIRVVRHA